MQSFATTRGEAATGGRSESLEREKGSWSGQGASPERRVERSVFHLRPKRLLMPREYGSDHLLDEFVAAFGRDPCVRRRVQEELDPSSTELGCDGLVL